MDPQTKKLVKKIIPPMVVDFIKRKSVHWRGDYPSWKAACEESTGYDEDQIIQKVDEATAQVVAGKFPYERDSVLFEEIEYSWPLLTSLLWSASLQGQLNVLDFGGALGSTYRQNIKFISKIKHQWNIVEQEKFVTLAKKKYETANLHFYLSIEECIAQQKPNTLLISSTLQYLEDPISFLEEIAQHAFPVIILDRVSIIAGNRNRLTVQTVPKNIYEAKYPCWFFSEAQLLEAIGKDYEVIEKFDSFIKNETFIDGSLHSSDFGYLLKRKS